MEESTAMARSQWERGLINHATGTSYELDASRMEESAAMACSEQARGVSFSSLSVEGHHLSRYRRLFTT